MSRMSKFGGDKRRQPKDIEREVGEVQSSGNGTYVNKF